MLHQYLQYQNRFSSQEKSPATQNSSTKPSEEEPKKIVTVYDSLDLINFNKNLAQEYILCGPSLMKVCLYNSKIAMKYGCSKIASSWRMAANCCKDTRTSKLRLPCNPNQKPALPTVPGGFELVARAKRNCGRFKSWTSHPDAKNLLNKIIARHSSIDFQTSAMICSVFAKATNKNVHIDGGTFFSTFADVPCRLTKELMSQSVEVIVEKSKEIIQNATSQRAAAIAARQLRNAQRLRGRKNLSECCADSQDRHSTKEHQKESAEGSAASDGAAGVHNLNTTSHNPHITNYDNHGTGRSGAIQLASSVANTSLRNIPTILLNLTSARSPARRSSMMNISLAGMHRSHSEANFNEDVSQWKDMSKVETESVSEVEEELNESDVDTYLLDHSKSEIYDQFRNIYSEMLRRYGLDEKAVEIMHLVENSISVKDAESFVMFKPPKTYKCPKCLNQCESFGSMCKKCRIRIDPKCVYCRMPVKGHVSACLACGHGGHLLHMKEWFENNDNCAAACGCFCLKEMERFEHIQVGDGLISHE